MKVLEAMRRLHEKDHFAELVESAMSNPPNPYGSRSADRKRGPIPQWTAILRPKVSEETRERLIKVSKRRGIALNAVVREALDAYLQANEEAWR